MAKLSPTRSAQWPLVSEFTFNFDDTIVATDGKVKNFADALEAEIINLPEGAVLIGGEIVVETAFNPSGSSPTAKASLGDSANAARYLNASSIAAAGRTAIAPTGHHVTENLRLTLAYTGGTAPTAGKATVRALYMLPGRANEVVPN